MQRRPLRYAECFLTPGHPLSHGEPWSRVSPSSSNRKLILAGQIAFLPTGILTTLLGPMLPIVIARWAMNDTQAGNLFLVQFLASLVGVQLAGVLLTRWGFRPRVSVGAAVDGMRSGHSLYGIARARAGLCGRVRFGTGANDPDKQFADCRDRVQFGFGPEFA